MNNKKIKLLTVVGARPQFIKTAAVSKSIHKLGQINEILLHTGQHYDSNMSKVFFDELEIPIPNYNLNVGSGSHGEQTGKMLQKIEQILLEEKPDCVLVYGDTNSTLAGALAAAKLNIPIAHIEAGLRSFNKSMPEEINRILTDRVSDLLFCPTKTAIKNLKLEGYKNFDKKVILSGDVMYDSVLFYSEKACSYSTILDDLNLDPGKYIICTIHRPENTDHLSRLESIVDALNGLNQDVKIIVVLHPRTNKVLKKRNIDCGFTIINAIGYLDMLNMVKNSKLIITDSGGLQKEAFFLQKYCITLRNETEWTELVTNGYNLLAGSSKRNIFSAYQKILEKDNKFIHGFYGDGNAGSIIVDKILTEFIH